MKIVLAEVPYTKDRDISVEKSCVPEGAELTMAVFDEHAENNDAFYAAIKDADIIIDGYVHFGKKEIDAMDHCEVISFQSTGYNEADLDYAKEKGIAVCSILDYCTQETAESAMALMLNLQRGIRQYDRSVQQDHVWDYQVVPHLKRIAGQVMGIAGLGRIGQSVARKAQAFDMEVIAYDPFLPPAIAENLGVKLVDFDTLLAESDVLSLHMNLTEENYHMFNKEAFMKCKKHPIIVNEGRGPLICDEDLVWALDNGYIRGAALDMVESEDPDLDTCPLVGRDDVLLTPHSGYYSDTSNYLVAKLSMDNALYYVNGEYDKVKSIRNGVNASAPSRLFPLGSQFPFSFFLPFFLFCFCDFNGYIFSPTSRPVDSKYPCPRPVSGTDTGLKTRMYRAPRQVPGAFLRLTLPGGNSKMKRTGGGPPEKGNVFLDRGGVSYGTCKSIFF